MATYDDYIKKYLKQGLWIAQDQNGTITCYHGPAGINKKEWLGPPAFVLHECPKFKGDWKESHRKPIKTKNN
jgi:hypothetical protein